MTITLHGIGVAGGIAIGHAHLVSQDTIDVLHYVLPASEVASEVARFDAAIRTTRKQLEMLWGSIPDNAPTELGAFLSLHIMLLNDHTLSREPRQIIETQRCNAEWALKQQQEALLAQFDEIEEEYLRERRNDVIQVVDRIFKALAGKPIDANLPKESNKDNILVAHDLSPADMVLFKSSDFAGFITDVGGSTSHTAIVARSLDMPSVLALHHARHLIHDGELLIVDGQRGVVIIDPSPVILAEYRKRVQQWQLEKRRLRSIKTTAARTLDGLEIDLSANIELPQDVDDVKANGAAGVGLFRSEFLFLSRESLPTEDEQFEAYRSVASQLEGQPVVIRTLDLGADKIARWAEADTAPNPALGLCGIRLCLAEPQLFRTQLRALLRASHYGHIKLLLPMITSTSEIIQTRHHLIHCMAELREEGLPFDENIALGGMIETPAAALTVPTLIKQLDFLSICTNDLIQYTLAIDRSDDSVASLYDPLHPAVLHLIHTTLKAAEKASTPVSVCGEMAGDVNLTRLLLGLGLRRFSMHPSHVLAVKQQVLRTDVSLIQTQVNKMLKLDDPDKLRNALAALNG